MIYIVDHANDREEVQLDRSAMRFHFRVGPCEKEISVICSQNGISERHRTIKRFDIF